MLTPTLLVLCARPTLASQSLESIVFARNSLDGFEDGAFIKQTIRNAKGSVKFWVKDNLLSKYEFSVQGSMEFNDREFDIDRTTTVEIKDIGTTKLTVPEAAKKKLS